MSYFRRSARQSPLPAIQVVDHQFDHDVRVSKGRKARRRRERELLLTLGPPNLGQSLNDEYMKMKTSKFKKEYLGKEYQRPWVSPTCPLRPRSMSITRLTSRGAHGAPHVSEAGQLLIHIFLLLMIRSRRGSHTA